MTISIETIINSSIESVWSSWITPEDIVNWNFASDDWSCPRAKLEFKEGGKFNYRMEAKDGSMDFDFEGTFNLIKEFERIEYSLEDNRKVSISFSDTGNGIKIVETFDAEDELSGEQQKQGWQSILDNFKKHVESKNE
jgi:uncharacterized protein YndB with AHSA1/START domain